MCGCSHAVLLNMTSNACHAALLAGGTGITPMVNLSHAILKNPNDKVKVRRSATACLSVTSSRLWILCPSGCILCHCCGLLLQASLSERVTPFLSAWLSRPCGAHVSSAEAVWGMGCAAAPDVREQQPGRCPAQAAPGRPGRRLLRQVQGG